MATDTKSLGPEYNPLGPHLENPYPFYRRARSEEPMFYSPMFDMWFVARHDDIAAILRDPVLFSSANTFPSLDNLPAGAREVLEAYRHPKHLINSDPPDHSRLRAFVNQGLTPSAVVSYEPWLRELADYLLEEIDVDRFDVMERFAFPFTLNAIFRVLGVPYEDMDRLRKWSEEMALCFTGAMFMAEPDLIEAARGMVAFQDYTAALVGDRQQNPRDDLISRLMQAEVRGFPRLEPEEVVSLLPGIVLAGHETTGRTIGNTLAAMLSRGLWTDLATAGDDGIGPLVEEGLRFESPILGMPRITTGPATVAGVDLPAGTQLFLLYASGNHDETVFSDPDSFRPGQADPTSHFAFGRGIHFCAGAALARLEAKVALSSLLRHFPRLTLVPDQPEIRVPSVVFRGVNSLLVDTGV